MGRYAKGIERRAAILDAALEMIGRNGFRNSTLADIAEAVGLTKAGVLHYFGSKDELYVEVLRLRDERGAPDGDPNLDGFVEAIRGNAKVGGLVHLFTAMAAAAVEEEHDAHEFFVDRYAWIRNQLEGAVRREAAKRTVGWRTRRANSATILLAIDGPPIRIAITCGCCGVRGRCGMRSPTCF